METYRKMKERHQKELDNFPMAFAFTEEDLKEGLKKLGLSENDKDKIIGIGFGGFIKKEDKEKYENMQDKHYKEIQDAIKSDKTGEGFIQSMFDDELANHEYGYTLCLNETLAACGLTYKDIEKNKNLQNGLKLATDKYRENELDEEEVEDQ